MELFTLNEDFQPKKTVENYESLIWSERYSTTGDFELKTSAIQKAMRLMPLESYVSLRDSTVPMKVEVYKIEKEKGKAPILTITGRSFEAVLGDRAATVTPPGTPKEAWTMSAARPSDAAYNAMRRVLGDVIRNRSSQVVVPQTPTQYNPNNVQPAVSLSSESPAVAPEDAIPEIDLVLPADYHQPTAWSIATDYVAKNVVISGGKIWEAKIDVASGGSAPSEGADWTELKYEIPPGDLYSAVQSLLGLNYHGIKSIRPGVGDSKVGVEIYNGADRRDRVVFDVRFDQVENATYLLSEAGSKNVAYTYGTLANGGMEIVNKTTTTPSGLNRRVMYLDVSGEGESVVDLNARGLIDLYKYNATALFDGEIAEWVATGYNTKYFLGDIIRLTGEYGLARDARVVEFIRSSDATGEKAYPTLEVVES